MVDIYNVEDEIAEIVTKVGGSFLTFGGGRGSNMNPVAEALKDAPLQFAAGVDVKQVVAMVLLWSARIQLRKVKENDGSGPDKDASSDAKRRAGSAVK